MKIADILRNIANNLDGATAGSVADPRLQNQAELIDVAIDDGQNGVEIDVDQENTADNDEVFLPPLQAKLELLKKAVGVDNIYDEQEDEQEDELVTLRRAAGINPGVMQELTNDEPLDD
jgi:hypothetical protein